MDADIFYLRSNPNDIEAIISEIPTHGGQLEYVSPILPIIAYKADVDLTDRLTDKYELVKLQSIPVGRVQEDLIGSLSQLTPLHINPKMDHVSLRNAGYTGWQKTIAILDSGVSEEWLKERYDFTGFGNDPYIEHGNKVANIIKRFARGATLISCKVTQSGEVKGLDVLKAIDFAVNDLKADIINMSLGFQVAHCDGTSCAICQTVSAYANRDNVLFVVAAGNEYIEGTICCPGKAAESITVGATGKTNDEVAAYSSKGMPGSMKPNILSSGSIVYNGKPDSGTSYSAPIVTGVSAAIMSGHSQMGPADIKNLLYSNATDIEQPSHHQGFGVMDVNEMLEVLSNGSGNGQSSGQSES